MGRGASGTAARVVGVVAFLILAPTLASAANASFTGTSRAATSYSTATLATPDAVSFPVSASCTKLLSAFHVSISATRAGSVQSANYLEMTVRSPSGALQFTGDLNDPLQRTYAAVTSFSAGRGTWTYEVRAKYKVPNSTNVWTSLPLTRTLTCS